MIELVLIRHAKAAPGGAAGSDHDRPLEARGRRDASAMARRAADAGVAPLRLLSSSAARARETAEVFAEVLGVPLAVDPDLYLASAGELLAAATAAGVPRVAVVAHDPGLSVLTDGLSQGRLGPLPPCAVAVFRWQTDDGDVAAALDPDHAELLTPRG